MIKPRPVQVPRNPSSQPPQLPEEETDDGDGDNDGSQLNGKPFWTKTTLQELGPNLPVGIEANGKRSKLIRFRPWTLKMEKELGAIRDKAKGMSMGRLVVEVLSMAIQTIGPHNFDQMKADERALVISNMVMFDVLYTYVYLRHQVLKGEPLSATIRCPACRWEFIFKGDLNTLEVRVVPEDRLDLRREYKLDDGLVVSEKLRHKLVLQPPNWSMFDSPEFIGSTHQGAREAAMLKNSIVEVEGIDIKPFLVSDTELEALTKYDLEGLVDHIEENALGPQMVIETQCDRCKTDIFHAIDWEYDSFFKRSSRRNQRRT